MAGLSNYNSSDGSGQQYYYNQSQAQNWGGGGGGGSGGAYGNVYQDPHYTGNAASDAYAARIRAGRANTAGYSASGYPTNGATNTSGGAYGNGSYGSGSGTGTGTGGSSSTNGNYSTSITAGGIWSDPQIQAQVNQSNAGIQQQANQAGQRAGQSAAARGYGAGSGLTAALQAGLRSNAAANQAKIENDLRWGAAQGNAQQLLASQGARANEGLGLAGLLQSQRNSDNQLQLAQQNRNLSLLSQYL